PENLLSRSVRKAPASHDASRDTPSPLRGCSGNASDVREPLSVAEILQARCFRADRERVGRRKRMARAMRTIEFAGVKTWPSRVGRKGGPLNSTSILRLLGP